MYTCFLIAECNRNAPECMRVLSSNRNCSMYAGDRIYVIPGPKFGNSTHIIGCASMQPVQHFFRDRFFFVWRAFKEIFTNLVFGRIGLEVD